MKCEICGGCIAVFQSPRQPGEFPCSCGDQPVERLLSGLRMILRRLAAIEKLLTEKRRDVRTIRITLAPVVTPGSPETMGATRREAVAGEIPGVTGGKSMIKAIKLIVGGLRAVLVLADAGGKAITGAEFTADGGTMAVVEANPSFATVTPTSPDNGGDGVTMFDILPLDPTAVAPGSSVISFTATNADGTQAVGTLTVADTDDVATIAVTATPIVPAGS